MTFSRCMVFSYVVVCFSAPLILAAPSWAGCVGASPSWHSTADFESVSHCVSQAAPGDTITVAGDATWAATLTLTRGITLVGSGNPTITGRRTLIYWTPDDNARAAHDTLRIEGFTFDGDNATFVEMGYTGILRVATAANGHVTLAIRNNTFRNVTGSSRGLYLQGKIYGVISSNVFDRIPIVLGVYGNDYESWRTQQQAYGVAETLYFEDNTIKFTYDLPSSGYAGWMQSGQGGREVVRYNTWDYSNVAKADEFWDLHGLQGAQSISPPAGCQNYSTMMGEFYGNKIVNQVGAYRWMAHRGGWMLMFYNSLSGTTSPYNGVTQYFCNTCQSPGSFNQKATNTYVFRNLANGLERPLTVYSPGDAPYGCASDPIVENADFFNFNSSFDGTTGVGCGELAARPATCTVGSAYWATSQSCSDLGDMVGAKPRQPISGTLYKCTGTNSWSPYYTPYQYPHPLAGPAAPRSVLIK